ncbi:Sodium/hydrogen exchanger [Gracilaria domingensis]|nr:Sodium/hydrogen exchanger [Gracilaria domingensis]
MSAESPSMSIPRDPNSTNQQFPSLSEFLQQATRSESLPRRNAWVYFTGTIIAFAIIVTMWSTSSASHRALQCPDCNCGAEGGAPPVSFEGAEAALGVGLSIFTLQLTFCIFATYILVQNRLMFLPSCIAYVLLGILVGSIVRISGASNALGFSLPNQEQFFTFILPPIILEAGYSLNKTDFYAEGLGILLLAVPGTLISALAFGVGMYFAGVLGISYFFSFWEAMTFGALLSAVDPVATIAIFSALKVNKTLHFLVFGESVLNDAVAIVLYRTFSRLIGYAVTSWYFPLLKFVYVFFGSVLVGATLAAITALLLKHTNLYRNPSLEFSFYLLMAYLPYPFCDGIGMSGILGILTSSVVLAHYAHYNLSKVTQISSQQVFRSLAFLAETFVFIYLGTALTTFNHSWHIATIVWGIIFTLASRAANIYPLTYLLNKWRTDKISKKTQLIMWFSGSLRGAIAWALSLSLPSRNGSDDTRRVVISSTLAIVLFTVIVLGGGMLPLLRLVRVEDEAIEAPDSDDQDDSESSDGVPNGTMLQESTSFASMFARRLSQLDENWLRPTLVASSTRSMIATNRTLQTLAVSAVERLTPHQLGSLLDSSAATDSPFPGELGAAHGLERGDLEMAAVTVNKGQLTLDSDS